MLMDTSNVVSMQQANRNFSEVSRLVEDKGSVVILKNNKPKYLVVKVEDVEQNINPLSDENIMEMSQALINMNKEAYKELAK